MAILVLSSNGTYVPKTDLATASTSADTLGQKIVVTSPITLTTAVTITGRQFDVTGQGKITFSGGGSLVLGAGVADRIKPQWFGAVGDSTGVTGNGTDNTVALQAAVKTAIASGVNIFIPSGIYRITAPIVFNGFGANKIKFEGENILSTTIFADFTSVAYRAALSLDNGPSGANRAYVDWENFTIRGVSDAKTSGIYVNWGSFTSFKKVQAIYCYNGIVVANDFHVTLWECYENFNLNNGAQFSYLIDQVTAGACNSVNLFRNNSVSNGANGVYGQAIRSFISTGGTSESNANANYYLDYVYGGVIEALYQEYATANSPSHANSTLGGIYVTNSQGLKIHTNADSFDAVSPIVHLASSNNGIDVHLAVENATVPMGIGVLVDGSSYSVKIGGSIRNCTTAVQLGDNAHATIEQLSMADNTNNVITANSSDSILDWKQATAAQVAASTLGAASVVDIEYLTGIKWKIGQVQRFTTSVMFSEMSSSTSKKIITATYSGEQWQILDIIVAGVTPFSGGGGNRAFQVSDGTHPYTVVPSSFLTGSIAPARWGSTDVPFPANVGDIYAPTALGTNLLLAYSGGSADYTAGQIDVTVVAQRVK